MSEYRRTGSIERVKELLNHEDEAWQINLNCAAGKNKPLFGSILLCYTVFTATLKSGAAIPTERRMANADWAKPFILSAQRKLHGLLGFLMEIELRKKKGAREGAPSCGPNAIRQNKYFV